MLIVAPGSGNRRVRNEAIRALQANNASLIYAVRTRDGLIKIGCSTDLVTRLDHIKGGVEEILALKPGTFADELAIHRSLRGHATEGREYYFPTPSVLRAVNAMRAPLGLDPIVQPRRWAA